ncbi:MAG: hypothetical protein WC609_00775 [Candidatus Paceibacterota bacterium]|jgi:hypothetical protein
MSGKGIFTDTRYAKEEGSKKIGRYEAYLLDFEKRGECPFCPRNLVLKALKKEGGWRIFNRSWKGESTEMHFLIIGVEHKTNLGELFSSDWVSINSLVKWTVDEYNIRGGGLAVRFGDTDYSGATIGHLHFHLIVPKMGDDGLSRPVNFPIG